MPNGKSCYIVWASTANTDEKLREADMDAGRNLSEAIRVSI